MKFKRKAGQALVEFVIILPIFIFMILAVIDLGKILYFKNNLEATMEDVITYYETEKTSDEILRKLKLDKEKVKLNIEKDDQYLEFSLEKHLDIITPGLNLIFKSPYSVSTKRVIYNE